MVSTIKLKGVKEVFNDYKKTSLLLVTCDCDFKCEKEGLCDVGTCQNLHLCNEPNIKIEIKKIINMFNDNFIVKSIVFGGLEPFLQFDEVYNFIKEFRKKNNEDVVIFTGYYPEELQNEIIKLKKFDNIIIKFGRFIQDSEPIYDELLGITLVSKTQFSKRIEYL